MSQVKSAAQSSGTMGNQPKRPSLLAANEGARATPDNESVNILSSLATLQGDNMSRSDGSRRATTALGWLALVAILAGGSYVIFTRGGSDRPAGNKPNAIPAPLGAMAHEEKGNTVAVVAPANTTTIAAHAPSQPAVIENISASAVAVPPFNAMPDATTALNITAVAPHNSPSPAAAPTVRENAVVEPALPSKPQRTSEAATSARAQSPQRAAITKHAQPRAASGANAQPRPSGDGDVALIAALIAHADGGTSARAEHAKNAASAAKSKRGADARNTTKVAASDLPADSSASNPPEPTTAEQLQHCQTLGFIADKLCKWRTCFGLWGKDAACSNSSS